MPCIFLKFYINQSSKQFLLFLHFPGLWNLNSFTWRVVSMLLLTLYTWKWFQFIIFYLTIFTIKSNSFQRKHELITTLFLLKQSWIVIKAVFISNKLQSAEVQNWSNILENFIALLYDFEKQWLSSFACEALVSRPVPQKFL